MSASGNTPPIIPACCHSSLNESIVAYSVVKKPKQFIANIVMIIEKKVYS